MNINLRPKKCSGQSRYGRYGRYGSYATVNYNAYLKNDQVTHPVPTRSIHDHSACMFVVYSPVALAQDII